jgi:acetoin utilization deacetylase AcuC-like enzyme
MNAKKVALLTSEMLLLHTPPSGHPERPDRLSTMMNHLRRTPLWKELVHLSPRQADEQEILRVHTKGHVEHIKQVCEQGGGVLDEGDTHAVPRSYEVALVAAGAALRATEAILTNEVEAAFCAVRPPGHHAERDRPMGFCLLNTGAIAARYAQDHFGLERVAIVDWDVHHGNGTQHIFEEDPSVYYFSLHQYPFYPGTGAAAERGRGKGEGYTMNIPFPAGTGEASYLQAFSESICPALSAFQPELLIISAGFDAHRDDPLGGMQLNENSFALMTEMLRPVAPILSVLEGGYDLHALAVSTERHLGALLMA